MTTRLKNFKAEEKAPVLSWNKSRKTPKIIMNRVVSDFMVSEKTSCVVPNISWANTAKPYKNSISMNPKYAMSLPADERTFHSTAMSGCRRKYLKYLRKETRMEIESKLNAMA